MFNCFVVWLFLKSAPSYHLASLEKDYSFDKMCSSFQIEDFETSITRSLLLTKAKKVKYLRYLKSNHPNFFSESSFGIYLQVCKNLNPITRRTSRTSSRWSSIKTVWATQNFIKDKMIGRADILRCILKKNIKKEKRKSQERKNIACHVTSILTFFFFFS